MIGRPSELQHALRAAAIGAALLSALACSGGTPSTDTPRNDTPATETSSTEAQPTESRPTGKLFPVTPVIRQAQAPAANLQISQTQFFSYALPEGWRLAEDGPFALTLAAPDNQALTIMLGNAGMPPTYPPVQYAYEKLMALQPQDLRLGEPRPAAPLAGFAQALEFDVSYTMRGVPWLGRVKAYIAPAYDTALLAMTAALSVANQWPGYSSWLPRVAEQVSATNGGAFGARGIMAQNLQNSTAYAEAARQYREASQRTQQQVTDDRNASEDRKNFYVRENLGGVQTYTDPYGSGPPLELPTTYKYFWIDRQGTVQGTDDPSVNPNAGSTTEWRKMERQQP